MAMQFTVIGRLAKDPEFKSVNDVKVLKLNVISNEKTKSGTEWRERSDGFYCDLYGLWVRQCSTIKPLVKVIWCTFKDVSTITAM